MSLITNTVAGLLQRDLNKLAAEIRSYPSEASIWKTAEGITNPAGNLVLHLTGNLQHYIGAVLGKSGYVRNRPEEFSLKNISREKLLELIATTQEVVARVLPRLDEAGMNNTYPERVFENEMSTGWFLIHLAGHLNYHLGQVNYHRRLLTGEGK